MSKLKKLLDKERKLKKRLKRIRRKITKAQIKKRVQSETSEIPEVYWRLIEQETARNILNTPPPGLFGLDRLPINPSLWTRLMFGRGANDFPEESPVLESKEE